MSLLCIRNFFSSYTQYHEHHGHHCTAIIGISYYCIHFIFHCRFLFLFYLHFIRSQCFFLYSYVYGLYTVHNQHTLPGLVVYRYIESRGKRCIGCMNIFCYHEFTTTMREKKIYAATRFPE